MENINNQLKFSVIIALCAFYFILTRHLSTRDTSARSLHVQADI